jgi:hypothetical protein
MTQDTGVVGIGQSANCTNGLILQPSASILQLNGNACASPDGYESCAARGHFLALSSCVNTCPDSVLPLKTPEGAWECASRDGEYQANVTNVEENVEASPPSKSPTSSASLLTTNGNAVLIMLALLVARFARK